MFAKEKCTAMVRKQINLVNGLDTATLVILGKHSYEWSVIIIERGMYRIITLPNRKSALREVRLLKQQFKMIGCCLLGAY